MTRSLLALGASIVALATVPVPAFAQASAPAAQAVPADASRPTINYGEWGFDPAGIDTAIDPGDDFYAYANSKWVNANEIPADRSRYGAFDSLSEKSRDDVRMLIADLEASDPAPGTAGHRILGAYRAFLDTDAIEARGLAPIQPYLDRIREAGSLDQLVGLFELPGYPSLVSAYVTVDSKAPDSYVPAIGFSGMGLPDRDYYLIDNERNETIRAAYMDYLGFMLGKAGYADPAATARQVYDFEHRVAELEWDREARRNRDLTYNKVSRAELQTMAGGFPIGTLLQTIDLDGQPSFTASQIPPTPAEIEELGLTEAQLAQIGGGLPAMMRLVEDTPLPVLKAWMAKSMMGSAAAVLPSDVDQAQFAFYGTVLSGAEQQEPRWKRAINATNSQLGEVVGQLYVDRFFPPESKAAMDDLVANLRKAYAQSLAENAFMGDATRSQAQAKLAAFNPKIGYPVEFEAYDGLDIRADDPLGNRVRSAAWQQKDNLKKLGQPVDRTEWGMLPMTVNAYYNPVFNEIVFPAAILQRPFFSAKNDPAVNYGGIGAVIGHEMGHGFDDQGAKYDATGMLDNWWQEEDLTRFQSLTSALAGQYDSYCPYDDGQTCVKGRFTLGENIGDNGGLAVAYRAYRMSLDGQEAPVIDGLTGDQRFFLSWAQVWRSMQREAAGRQQLQTDPHSPAQYRVNGSVRNQNAWYEAFNVQPGDALYLAPEDRVHIW